MPCTVRGAGNYGLSPHPGSPPFSVSARMLTVYCLMCSELSRWQAENDLQFLSVKKEPKTEPAAKLPLPGPPSSDAVAVSSSSSSSSSSTNQSTEMSTTSQPKRKRTLKRKSSSMLARIADSSTLKFHAKSQSDVENTEAALQLLEQRTLEEEKQRRRLANLQQCTLGLFALCWALCSRHSELVLLCVQ